MMTTTQAIAHLQALRTEANSEALDMAIQALSDDPRRELLEMLISEAQGMIEREKKVRSTKTPADPAWDLASGIIIGYEARIFRYNAILKDMRWKCIDCGSYLKTW